VIARRPGIVGRVTGVDLSPYLVEMATRLAREEGLAERIESLAGYTRGLDLPDRTLDAVVATPC
jgi:ubiquinone/menaquinone biosynthesis C-methylase UbiE